MLRLIVVPLDGSSFGEQALPLAVRLAERHHAELELVHVFESIAPYMVQGAPPLDPALDAELRSDRQKYLDFVAERLRRTTSVKVDAVALSAELGADDVVSTLVDHLTERRADLAVMATHGRGGLSRFWVGSVATGVVRRSDKPALLVRATERPSTETPSLRHVLIPLDGTPADDEALDNAIAAADVNSPEFLLVHVREPLTYFGDSALAPIAQEELESAMKEYLEKVARRIRARGFTATTEVIVDPSPAGAILHVADARDIDLIAMETHARKGVSRLIHGSVTDKVIRGARVPVLVHRRRAELEQGTTAAAANSATEWR